MSDTGSFNIKEISVSGVLGVKENNPRNSEGSFLQLSDGRIAYAYSRYSGKSDCDHAPCDICVIYSYDNGKTFDTDNYETLVYADDYSEQNVMSVTLRYMNNGDIGLFYLLKHSGLSSEYYLRRYKRNFQDFIGETKCLPFGYKGYFVVNNDRVLNTADGKWIIPAAFHQTSVSKNDYFDGRGSVYFFVSHDDGISWKQSNEVLRLNDTYSHTGLQEPGLAELQNDVLYCYSRTDKSYQYESVSIDGGEHWFNAQPSRFTSPNSPMLIKKNPYSKKYYAVWNPTPVSFTHPDSNVSWGRTPLVIAESIDGIHFSTPYVLEDDENRGFCYPAMYFTDEKTILISYCAGGEAEGCCLDKTVIKKINLY